MLIKEFLSIATLVVWVILVGEVEIECFRSFYLLKVSNHKTEILLYT